MSERPSRPSSPHLEVPPKGVELEDPGTQDSVINSDEDHFSDASEGRERSDSQPLSDRASPVPLTRVERVDENPAYGEVPGTSAYEIRERDAVPDQIEVIPEGSRSRSASTAGPSRRPSDAGEPSIPRTVVEVVNPDEPSHGDVPGTLAYEQRKADAVPDVVMTTPGPSPSLSPESNAADVEVPETVLSRVDSSPEQDESPHPRAHQRKPSDALPDVTKTVPDAPDPSSPQLVPKDHDESESSPEGDNETADAEPADEFDDFAEEQEMGEDDFGDFDDFDDGFQEPEPVPSQPPTPPSVPPLIDFDSFQSLPDLYAALDEPLDHLFPTTKEIASLPPVEPIQNSSAIFNTERSLSLWSQLVAPPPLQPQNWVKSRIRRLFLVSLGVPVDLDEILPASKQKKLVLPSINTGLEPRLSGNHSRSGSRARASQPDSPSTTSRYRTSRRREPSPPPELDLPSVHRLCATTDAALDGMTDPELKGHVKDVEQVTLRASSVLEYWLKRRDGLVSEKEAFEGVIENLVSHARRVRK
ncbi:uncharacterized protein BDW47DRAFT_112445 [Aspergillus candidus]|uniref:Uncharacterized protein n=1 Tax=Aspergillus candidus TaxID=41067 RepID=A0A2I2F146_ASPCN|nr:hypothetical protein BDW47DRAFT_112445 [Aspergillus candidus]PLB34339.1 hypothetical protein BDW47DRAFT_112445 [Aspergillus candidus]